MISTESRYANTGNGIGALDLGLGSIVYFFTSESSGYTCECLGSESHSIYLDSESNLGSSVALSGRKKCYTLSVYNESGLLTSERRSWDLEVNSLGNGFNLTVRLTGSTS